MPTKKRKLPYTQSIVIDDIKIGLIAGNFDVIHPGYVRYFEDAKNHCKHLIIALHVDPTIERPEKMKPILTKEERTEVLLSIKYNGQLSYP